MQQEAWLVCQGELILLIEQIETAHNEAAQKKLRCILYGEGGYDMYTVNQARKKLHPKLLLKLDSFERSKYCGPR